MRNLKTNRRLAFLVAALPFLTACPASVHVVSNPSSITFEAAMESVGKGLNKIYEVRRDHDRSGLLPKVFRLRNRHDSVLAGKQNVDEFYRYFVTARGLQGSLGSSACLSAADLGDVCGGLQIQGV
jgi:hypothetical protein